jgi:hypothetical protein
MDYAASDNRIRSFKGIDERNGDTQILDETDLIYLCSFIIQIIQVD